jgi:hypothetical protein
MHRIEQNNPICPDYPELVAINLKTDLEKERDAGNNPRSVQ